MTSQNPYIRAVQKFRYTKDSFFKFSPESPLAINEKRPFIALNYFDPDPAYKVKATLVHLENPEPISIQMSGGVNEQYYKMGFLEFRLKGKDCKLAVYQSGDFLRKNIHQDELFLPFSDATNGKSTYAGGRFMDIDYSGQDTINLDFNYAYNPSCAYNHDFSCPVPPAENHLPIEINAGEQLYGNKVRFF
jgi:hypothetical protein